MKIDNFIKEISAEIILKIFKVKRNMIKMVLVLNVMKGRH